MIAATAAAMVALVLTFATGATAGSSFSKTETITRTHLVDGADVVADSRTFHVTVDQTTKLRDRQEINVTWSGAHPTGGLVADPNSSLAGQQEYPVVLMECRGVDSASAPASKRVTPETCWTHSARERAQSSQSFDFPPYRLDRYASPSERKRFVGLPSPLPSSCIAFASGVQHWIPFRAADGTVYGGGPGGCAGVAPDAIDVEGSFQPSNTTYAPSDLSGKGSAKFVISTSDSNASLGCSNTVPCSLVIIPIMGISCDPTGADLPEEDRPPADVQEQALGACSATGHFAPGERSPGGTDAEDLAVAGELWWSESNWRNRISVPLQFGQPSNVCDSASDSAPAYIYGSELLTQATLQWAPAFCLDRNLFKLAHVHTAEPQAKNLLRTGTVNAAFEAGPPEPPFERPIVQAPTALTGFAITFLIDDATGRQRTTLRLTPRLLAKLLTQSYPGLTAVQSDYKALSHNPLSLATDPEFEALNPGGHPSIDTAPAATLFSLSSDSDVIWALTSYIEADPDARAWLDGKPDPWGMVVNPNYSGIQLPVNSWPLRDTFQTGSLYSGDINPCLASNPSPILPLVAAPVQTLAQLALNMQFGVANSQIVCKDGGLPTQKLVSLGREASGQRFIVGLTSLADAKRYQLETASLLTHTAPGAAEKFDDAAGRTFVAPNDASLRAAARLFKPDEEAGTWILPYDELRASADGADAYPGTTLVSTAVLTQGIPVTDAKRYAEFLRFAAGAGQQPGFGNGQLPPGYLPMTAGNGMSTFIRYTQLAADAVAAQEGATISVTTLKTTTPPPSGGDGTDGSGTPPTGTDAGGGTDTTNPNGQNPADTDGTGSDGEIPAVGQTLSVGSGPGGLAAPLALGLALILALAAGGTWFFGRPRINP